MPDAVRRIGAFAAAIALAPVATSAQDTATTITMRAFDTVAIFQPPPWSAAPDVADKSEISRKQGKSPNDTDVFIWELIPKGDNFEAWVELYALMAETPLEGTAQEYRDGVFQLYTQACTGAEMTKVLEAQDQQIFTLFCPAYKSGSSTGEIAVMHYRMQGKTLVKNYYHHRGPAFTVDDDFTWPMSAEKLDAVLESIQSFRLTPATE